MTQQPLAYHDLEFLDSSEARPIRILSEYLEPRKRFRTENIQDTVVFFGSARTLSREGAERALARLGSDEARKAADYEAALKRGQKALEWSRYYEDARRLAHMLTTWSLSLEEPRRRFVVCSGGGPGIMEAANRGATEAGGKTVGLNIRLPFEQGPNPYITDGLHFEFHYFFMRKFWFAYLAKALIVFPGGFGTLDEMFEILTLDQTDYWDQILNLEPMLEWGAVSSEDVDMLCRVDTPEAAFEQLKEHLLTHHIVPATAQEATAPGIAKTRG